MSHPPAIMYTDYPDLKIRRIQLLAYDGNKSCCVKFIDGDEFVPYDAFRESSHEMTINSDYIFRSRRKKYGSISHKTLSRWSK